MKLEIRLFTLGVLLVSLIVIASRHLSVAAL
jgi:hypothetical protein